MSDARALLRQQQASQQIDHPLAVYSSSGALSCLLCDTLVKTEGLWNSHLRSSGHRARVKIQNDRDRDQGNAGVKRPARDEGDNRLQSPKKRARPEGEENGEEGKVRRGSLGLGVGVEITMATRPATPGRRGQMGVSQFEAVVSEVDVTMAEPEAPAQSVAGTTQEDGKGDEVDDDWAAFQVDIAATTATFGGDAIVSVAAKSAEQIKEEEAQAETGQKKEKAEVRIEEEREEAKERLAEEFEEMEKLERKVRELKERRERLKGAKLAGTLEEKAEVKKVEKEELDDDSDESEDEDEDDWAGFRFKEAIN